MAAQITSLKSVNLLSVLRELQTIEWANLNLDLPSPGQRINLPDGRDDIHSRLWSEIIDTQYGNQQFSNDSFYRLSFELDEDDQVYIDDLSDDMKLLIKYCKEAMNDDGGWTFLLFDVCW